MKKKGYTFILVSALVILSVIYNGVLLSKLEIVKQEAASVTSLLEQGREDVNELKEALEKQSRQEELEEQDRAHIRDFITRSMLIVRPRISEMKKMSITAILSGIALEQFKTREERELWIAVIANESGFNPKAQSPVGAIGLGQVMPKSAEWYGKKCGLADVRPNDLFDSYVNAVVSACIFKQILKNVEGSPSLALISYNAGSFSKDLKKINRLENINTETANYIAKITRFLELVEESPTE